jgi:hypothetical protein
MMCRLKSEQGELFYEFCLGDAVPEDHLVRKIFERSRHERKKIEMRFAHLKRILKLGRLRLRGREAPRMSSFWPPSLRTCDGSRC